MCPFADNRSELDLCIEEIKQLQVKADRYLDFILEWKDVLLTNMTEEDFEQSLKGE